MLRLFNMKKAFVKIQPVTHKLMKWSHKVATESEAIIKADRNEHYHCKEHTTIHENAFKNVSLKIHTKCCSFHPAKETTCYHKIY